MNDDVMTQESMLRDRALTRIKQRRDFAGHVMIYVLVNTFLVGIWAVTSGADGHFWPIYPILGWGIGVVANAYDVFFAKEITEDDIRHEMERLAAR